MAESEQGYFTEANSAEVVISRNAQAKDARLAEVMASITRHLHAVVKEVEPTPEEWMAALLFLTRTGQISTEWRQEWILLSDVLGVSMLVDAVASRKSTGATETTVLGPFYVTGAPVLPHGANISLDGKGAPVVVRGHVRDVDGRPIAGATLDVWQANEDGFYDVQQKGVQPDMNLRGLFTTGSEGEYWFRSARPRYYPIPHDGPVGQLLAALGRHPYRPAHLHFIVRADGFRSITTHIFTADCQYLHSDAVFGVKASLVGNWHLVDDAAAAAALGVASPFWAVDCDFVLARA